MTTGSPRSRERLAALSNHPLARDAAWTTGGDGIRLVLQALVFFVLAALLGVDDFGLFGGSIAVATILNQFSAWGSDQVALKEVSRDASSFHRWFGTSIVVTLLVGSALSAATMLLGNAIFAENFRPWMMLWILISDVLLFRLILVVSHGFQSRDLLGASAAVRVGWGVGRFGAVMVFAFVVDDHDPTTWAAMLVVSNVVVLAVSLWVIVRRLGAPVFMHPMQHMQWREGAFFAAGLSARMVNLDTDKAIVLRMRGQQTAGEYIAAYRITALAAAPLHGLVFAGLPRLFRLGEEGISASVRAARRLAPAVLLYGLASAALLFLVRPLIPVLVGDDFAGSADILTWLAFIPLMDGSVLMASAVLITSGNVRFVSVAQMTTAVLNALLSIVLIGEYSWRGAVLGTYIAESLLLVLLIHRIRTECRVQPD